MRVNVAPYTPPTITTPATLPGGTQGVFYSITLAAIGGVTPYTWLDLSDTGSGLTLNPLVGVLSGTPNAGNFTIQVQIRDAVSAPSAPTNFTLSVAGGVVSITTASPLPQGTVAIPYSKTLAATGGSGIYTNWAVTTGSLPAGLSLNPATGVISGTPTAAVTADSFAVTVTDSIGDHGSKTFALTIQAAGTVLTIYDGQTNVVVSVTGTKNHSATLEFDRGTAALGTVDPGWTGGAYPNGYTGSQSDYNAGNVNAGLQVSGSTIAAPTPYTSVFLGGTVANGDGGANFRQYGPVYVFTKPSFPFYSFFDGYYRQDPAWQFGFTDDNMKQYVYTDGSTVPFGTGSNPFYYWGCNNAIGGYFNNTGSTWTISTQPDAGGSPVTTLLDSPDNNGHGVYWPSGSDGNTAPLNPCNPANGWIKRTWRIKWTLDGTGYIIMEENGKRCIDYQGQTAFPSAATNMNEAWGLQYTRDYGTTASPTTKNAMYMANSMYDNDTSSNAQLILTNNSVYGSSTWFEPQPWANWAGGSATISKVNIGNVPVGAAYLWEVTDSLVGSIPTVTATLVAQCNVVAVPVLTTATGFQNKWNPMQGAQLTTALAGASNYATRVSSVYAPSYPVITPRPFFFQLFVRWIDIEPTYHSYTHAAYVQDINYLAAQGIHTVLKIASYSNQSAPQNTLPAYLYPAGGDPNYVQSLYGPGYYALDVAGQEEMRAAFWMTGVQNAYVAAVTAIMQNLPITVLGVTYAGLDACPWVDIIIFDEETQPSAEGQAVSGAYGTVNTNPAGTTPYSATGWNAGIQAMIPELVAACPHTTVNTPFNQIPQITTGTAVADALAFGAAIVSAGSAQGAPDLLPSATTPIPAGGTVYPGEEGVVVYLGTAQTPNLGNAPSTGIIPYFASIEQDDMDGTLGSYTCAQMFTYATSTLKAPFISWPVDLSGTAPTNVQWFNTVIPFINANTIPAALNNYPSGFRGAFNYFISPTGSDSNPGTLAAPWALTALNSKGSTYAGKNVGIIGDQGTYSCLTIYGGGSYPAGLFPGALFAIQGGSSGSPTVVASCNSSGVYVRGLAHLDGQATSSNNAAGVSIIGNVAQTNPNYITLDGLYITGAYYHSVTFGAQDTISPTTLSLGIVVQNNEISGSTNVQVQENPTCLTLYACNGALIQNNAFTNATDQTGQNRASCFEQWSSINSIIQYNSCIGSASTSIGIVCKNAGNQNNTIRFNFIDLTAIGTGGSNSNQGGIIVDDDGVATSTDVVNNNIVIASLPLGNNDINVGQYPDWLSGFNCYNNTFVGVPGGLNLFCAHYSAPGTFQNYNNIYYETTATSNVRGILNAMNGSTAGTGNLSLSDYNCYYNLATVGAGISAYAAPGASYPPAPTLVHTLAAFAAQMPTATIGKEAHSTIVAPTFSGGTPSGAAGTTPAFYQQTTGSGKGTGSTNGQTSGTATDMGAWGNGATQIGCNFTII